MSKLPPSSYAFIVAGLFSLALFPSSAEAVCSPNFQCLQASPQMGDPVAPYLKKGDGSPLPGTGLCAAFKSTTQPLSHFDQRLNWPADAADFPRDFNKFMDVIPAAGPDGQRCDQTLLTPFDLTNNVNIAGIDASGDYVNTQGCPAAPGYGCDFPCSTGANLSSGFGTRYRGFINVPPEWAGQSMHLGFYADNAVSVSVFSVPKPPAPPYPLTEHLLISHAITPNSQVRVTNSVSFPVAGLYPIEINHAQYDAAAVLEFAVLFGDFLDIDAENNPMSQKLNDPRAPFKMAGYTDPANFFQTQSGAPPYAVASACKQCPRVYAAFDGQPLDGSICDPGYFCNHAAVCSPCIGNNFCGKSCQPCKAPKPFCIPTPGGTDPTDATCVQCRDTPDCPSGQLCLGHVCTTPDLCCPDTPKLVAPDPTKPTQKVCSQCQSDADCGGAKCDLKNLRCIDAIPEHNDDNNCGPRGVDCATADKNRTHCLNGQVCVQCRTNFDCGAGEFCLSGDCVGCKADRHCGPRCTSCGRTLTLSSDGMSAVASSADKPFCYTPDDTVGAAVCVRCTKDADCGEGRTCDLGTHDCTPACDMTCPEGKLCNGNRCVECFSSAQCPCGACDLSTGTCSGICESNQDCMGNQCCTLDPSGIRKCLSGRCAGTAGGALCGCSVAAAATSPVDNNTINPFGGALVEDVGRSRGVMLALLAVLFSALFLRRRLVVKGADR